MARHASLSFLDLPTEVRLHLYLYAIPRQRTITISIAGHREHRPCDRCNDYRGDKISILPLWLAHPLISEEVTFLLYKNNIIHLPTPARAQTFIQTIGEKNASAITELKVDVDDVYCDNRRRWKDIKAPIPPLPRLTGLLSLHLVEMHIELPDCDKFGLWSSVPRDYEDYILACEIRKHVPWLTRAFAEFDHHRQVGGACFKIDTVGEDTTVWTFLPLCLGCFANRCHQFDYKLSAGKTLVREVRALMPDKGWWWTKC